MKQTNLLKGILALVALLCSTHSWAYDFEVDNIQYTVISLDELTAEVSGLSDKSVTDVVIPETVEYKSRTLTVSSIGNSAFYSCTGLESVTIPNSATKIGDYAFYECSGLTEVSIPNSVTSIGNYAFRDCTGLESVTIPNSVTSIGNYAFRDCSGLTEVSIPNSVTSIGNYAFSGCIGLTGTLTIPNSVIEIGNYAFYGCIRLTEITIGVNVTTIGSCAFSDCTRLTQVTIGNSVTEIGNGAFSNCLGLTEVNFNAIACTSAGSSYSNRAFCFCDNISTVNFGDNVTIIPAYLCYGLTGLRQVTIPESVTEIGGYAFYKCSGLTSVTIGNSVTSISGYAFYGCSSLKELDIPNSVTSINNYAFHGCKGLETLEIGTEMKYLCDYSVKNAYRYQYYYYPWLWEDGPSSMESIILKDGTSSFRIRGYGDTSIYTNITAEGYPMFSNINVGYYYVGRPLIDISNWTYYRDSWDYNRMFGITVSQPYGTIKTLEINGYCTEVPYFYQSVNYLILGEKVETYEAENIYQGNLKGIICRSAVPPTLSGTFENSTYVNTIIYVPIGSKATYEATDGWKTFWDIQELDMQSIPPGYSDAVESITAYVKADVFGYYTIDGKRVSQPQRGINIIRYSDGTARKVLMR